MSKQQNRGTDSIVFNVRMRQEKPHDLKSHFRNCVREVMGYFLSQAKRNPERFVYSGLKAIVKNAKHYEADKDGNQPLKRRHYTSSQAQRSIRLLEEWGIIQWFEWTLGGHEYGGWLVARHEDVTTVEGGQCKLGIKPTSVTRKRGQKREPGIRPVTVAGHVQPRPDRVLDTPGHVPHAPVFEPDATGCEPDAERTLQQLQGDLEGDLNGPSRRFEDQPKAIIKAITQAITQAITEAITPEAQATESTNVTDAVDEKVAAEVAAEVAGPCQPWSNSRGTTPVPAVEDGASLSDADPEPRPGKTIGEALAFGGCPPDEDIGVVSDGEYDTAFLKDYKHAKELQRCLWNAHEELADQPYRGRASHAKLMGLAMEELRREHGQDAPKGWVPVMRKLRGATALAAAGKDN